MMNGARTEMQQAFGHRSRDHDQNLGQRGGFKGYFGNGNRKKSGEIKEEHFNA